MRRWEEWLLFAMAALLEVCDLTVHFRVNASSEFAAVRSASFQVFPGEVLGVLGESGCGKTTLALSILRLLPPNARVARGSVRFRGKDLFAHKESELRKVRGAEISMVFQEPSLALSPVMRVGDQIAQVIRAHRAWSGGRSREEAEWMLAQVHLRDAARIYDAYPHQLSGGQLQRVVIAQALACGPSLVIADEPTASLDTTVQAKILGLLKDLKQQFQTALILISHDPGVLATLADRLLVMYAGQIVETGPRSSVFAQPLHPYTQGLLRSMRRPAPSGEGPQPPAPVGGVQVRKLYSISGSPPDMAALPPGCPFQPRCPERMEICAAREPSEFTVETSRHVRCFKYGS